MEFPKSKFASPLVALLSLVIMPGLLNSCRQGKRSSYINEEASVSVPGMPFQVDQGIFLNQYATPSSRTTSWLLADSNFINSHPTAAHFFSARSKGKLCILHWSQKDDPVWIGARIPGRLLWVDLLLYENDTLVIKQYQPNGTMVMASERYRMEVEGLLGEIDGVGW